MNSTQGTSEEQSDGRHITVVSAGVSDPSTTTKLGEAVALEAARHLRANGFDMPVRLVDLRPLARDVAVAAVSRQVSPALKRAIGIVATSDGVVAASPVFKASYSGLFKEFWDVTEPDVMLAMPVVVVATGGSDRHALVPDTDMRSLFAFLRAIVAPTSIMAAGGDWASTGLADRERRAGRELGAFILSGVRQAVLDAAGKGYRRSFASVTMDESASAASAAPTDFDSGLMRLAAGGLGID
ncbi:CE1759 family FMN reductase [uncultured Bifidobacterium sp.]|uniref:CE1759 family FMN reductase n=1 Tax=uncultured Bifidobacterium sp. TaxID=165187 RepID=UPI0028DCF1FC|nr:CE1759 family FMN reductase [uncultured Bifidobacterium sp.]